MLQILRLVAYLAVIGIGAFIAASRGPRRRNAILFLFAYLGAIYFGVLITKKESWPFGSYQALHGIASIDVNIWRMDFAGVDRNGREWVVDPWTFDSVYQIPLQIWTLAYFKQLPVTQQRDVLAYMLSTAERGRARLAAGHHVGAERWLGTFAIPNWFSMKRVDAVSPEPFTGLRLYFVEWTARRRVEHRSLYAEYVPR